MILEKLIKNYQARVELEEAAILVLEASGDDTSRRKLALSIYLQLVDKLKQALAEQEKEEEVVVEIIRTCPPIPLEEEDFKVKYTGYWC